MTAPKPTPNQCSEKARLWIEFRQMARAYQVALAEFRQNFNQVANDDYQPLNDALENVRQVFEVARERLATHISGHRCW